MHYSIKTSSWQALGPRKFKPRLLYHTARASCMLSSAYGFWSYFICIQWRTRARIDFSNFSRWMRYSRIMLAVVCVGLVGREGNVFLHCTQKRVQIWYPSSTGQCLPSYFFHEIHVILHGILVTCIEIDCWPQRLGVDTFSVGSKTTKFNCFRSSIWFEKYG